MLYMVYHIYQKHHLYNEYKKLVVSYKKDRMEYLKILNKSY